MLDALPPEVSAALSGLLLAALLALIGILAQAIRVGQQRAVSWLDGLSADRRWQAAIARLDTAAAAAVDEVEQRMASELRAMPAGGVGKLSAEQARRLASEALTVARQHFGPETWAGVLEDLQLSSERVIQLLSTRIESAYRSRKTTPGLSVELDATGTVTATVDAGPGSE